MSQTLLAEAERVLHGHAPASFDTTNDAFAACIEFVSAVEDERAWRAAYWSLDAFYDAHTARHPDIRFYGEARRELERAEASSEYETPTQRLERLRRRTIST
jgi:hypothetical protein